MRLPQRVIPSPSVPKRKPQPATPDPVSPQTHPLYLNSPTQLSTPNPKPSITNPDVQLYQ